MYDYGRRPQDNFDDGYEGERETYTATYRVRTRGLTFCTKWLLAICNGHSRIYLALHTEVKRTSRISVLLKGVFQKERGIQLQPHTERMERMRFCTIKFDFTCDNKSLLIKAFM